MFPSSRVLVSLLSGPWWVCVPERSPAAFANCLHPRNRSVWLIWTAWWVCWVRGRVPVCSPVRLDGSPDQQRVPGFLDVPVLVYPVLVYPVPIDPVPADPVRVDPVPAGPVPQPDVLAAAGASWAGAVYGIPVHSEVLD